MLVGNHWHPKLNVFQQELNLGTYDRESNKLNARLPSGLWKTAVPDEVLHRDWISLNYSQLKALLSICTPDDLSVKCLNTIGAFREALIQVKQASSSHSDPRKWIICIQKRKLFHKWNSLGIFGMCWHGNLLHLWGEREKKVPVNLCSTVKQKSFYLSFSVTTSTFVFTDHWVPSEWRITECCDCTVRSQATWLLSTRIRNPIWRFYSRWNLPLLRSTVCNHFRACCKSMPSTAI